MELDYYVFHDVPSYHGNTILNHEEDLINSLGGKWKAKIKEMKPTLLYDHDSKRLLISINRKGQNLPVINEEGLNKSEKNFVELLYGVLERELSDLQNPESDEEEFTPEYDIEDGLEELMISAKEDPSFKEDDPDLDIDNSSLRLI